LFVKAVKSGWRIMTMEIDYTDYVGAIKFCTWLKEKGIINTEFLFMLVNEFGDNINHEEII